MSTTHAIRNIKPADLPAPPQAALEILRACAAEEVDQRTLAQFAQTDPVLTAEILRVVNTPLFGLGREISSVKSAISLLGIRTLRSIVLCLMVREAVQERCIDGLNLTEFWEDTLRRATCARELARFLQQDADEAFTLGMLQDFGTLLLLWLHPQYAVEYSALRRLDPRAVSARELEMFATTHTEIFALLARAWSLPESMLTAIVNHHQPQDQSAAKLLHCCDWVNAVFSADNINATFDQARTLLHTELQLSSEQIQQLFDQLPGYVEQSATALGLHIPGQTDFAGLLRQANQRLAKDNTEYQELTWQLEKAIAERDHLARELDQEIALACEIQRRLMPAINEKDLPVYGINIPARNISGDFYDYLQHKDGAIWFMLGDVAGKGINAGMLMAKTASLFRCLAKYMTDPVRLVEMINEELCETSTRGLFVTLVAGIYSPASGEVRLVNAGHLPVIVLQQDAQPLLLPALAPPLGILPGMAYPASDTISLHHKVLYLYSDGVTESPVAAGQMLEVNGLIELIAEHAGKPAAQRLPAIVDALQPDRQLHDDITLLMLAPE